MQPTQGAQTNNRANGQRVQRQQVQYDVETERQSFIAALNDPTIAQEYKTLLGPDVDWKRFVSTTIDVLTSKPKLLNPAPAFRSSLFFSLKKAAKQGLEPDGVQGALVPRWDNDARTELVQWQPMVRGIQLAARRAGIKKIAADFVLAGEPFRVMSGDDERIEHEWKADIRDKAYGLLRMVRQGEPDPQAPPDQQQGGGMVITQDFDAFWDQIVAAYCIVTTPEGEKIRRVMPRTRLLLLRDMSKAGRRSPWFGPFMDEMIVKAAIHFGMKRFPLESTDPERLARIQRFNEALDQDMEADLGLDDDDRTINHEPPPPASTGASVTRALPAPDQTLNNLSSQIAGNQQRERETVPAGNGGQDQQQRQEPQGQQQTVHQGSRWDENGKYQDGDQHQQGQQGPQGGQQPQGQQQPQGGQQTAQQQREPQTAQEARQQTTAQQGGTTSLPATQARAGEDQAKKFAEQAVADVWSAATMSPDGITAIAEFAGNKAIASKLTRLRSSYGAAYRNVLLAFCRQGVIEKIAGIQSTNPQLYDDIVAESSQQQKQAA